MKEGQSVNGVVVSRAGIGLRRRRAGWISVADRKRGFETVLWYQGMSRVCPGCPQATPREEWETSCIRKAYGEHPGANAECGVRNAE